MNLLTWLARLGAAAVVLSLPACFASYGKWTYPSGHYPTTTSPQPAKAFVLVEPLLDQRGGENLSSMSWSYVPLWPIGWSHFDRPEATIHGADTTQYVADPCLEVPRSIVIDCSASGSSIARSSRPTIAAASARRTGCAACCARSPSRRRGGRTAAISGETTTLGRPLRAAAAGSTATCRRQSASDADHARRHPLAHATVGSGERVQRDMGHFLVFVIMESQDDVRPRVADAFARYEERVAGDENAIHVAYYLLGGRWHAALTGQRPDDLAKIPSADAVLTGQPPHWLPRAEPDPYTISQMATCVRSPQSRGRASGRAAVAGGAMEFFGWCPGPPEREAARDAVQRLRRTHAAMYVAAVDAKA
jgi:hypothetical protein